MAEAEQAPRSLPVLAEIPARVQALYNPLPRAREAELVQVDRAGPANELAQPFEVLVLLCLFVSGSTYVSCAMRFFFVSFAVVYLRRLPVVLGALWLAGSYAHFASSRFFS